MKYLKQSIILTAALLLPLALMAGPGHDDHDRSSRQATGDMSSLVLSKLKRAVHHLDLSEAQQEEIHLIMQSSHEDLKANQLAAREGLEQLHEVIMAPDLDEEALAEIARLEGDLVAERVMLTGTAASQVLATLDDDQRATLHDMAERMREHHNIMREKRRSETPSP